MFYAPHIFKIGKRFFQLTYSTIVIISTENQTKTKTTKRITQPKCTNFEVFHFSSNNFGMIVKGAGASNILFHARLHDDDDDDNIYHQWVIKVSVLRFILRQGDYFIHCHINISILTNIVA